MRRKLVEGWGVKEKKNRGEKSYVEKIRKKSKEEEFGGRCLGKLEKKKNKKKQTEWKKLKEDK